MSKLSNRIEEYRSLSDHKLLPRLPIIIELNCRNSAKLTNLLDKPFDPKLSECFLSTALRLTSEIEGAVFAYQYSDQIVIIVRNDQNNDTNPWYDGRLQKLSSITSSIATLHFNDCIKAIDLNLTNDPIFASQVYAVPNISEAINSIVYHQQANFHSSIQFACFYELIKRYDKIAIKEMLNGLTIDEKIDLLRQECQIDFNEYSSSFRRGSGIYKTPKIVNNEMKSKWSVDLELPIFTKDQSFLTNLLKFGQDIFRQ